MSPTKSNFFILLSKLAESSKEEALVYNGKSYSYKKLSEKVKQWQTILNSKQVKRGQIVALKSEFSFESISLLLALFSNNNIVAMIPAIAADDNTYLKDAQVEHVFRFKDSNTYNHEQNVQVIDNQMLISLKKSNHGGFIIYSSGTTGRPKAILHDLEKFLSKFLSAKKKFRTLAFLLFDHIAGMDTLFYTLYSGATIILPQERGTEYICRTIEEQRLEVLPVSPSFLNLICLSHDYERYDLSSLKIITYGSEPMSKYTLQRINEIFPQVRILNKYGMSEFGSPPSKSKDNTDTWLKMGSQDVKIKVLDDIMWVKSDSMMLGYLNSPNIIDSDGWMCTGDQVVVDGDWIKILGRKSDIINVGGEKVFPSEVESVLLQIDEIEDAVVIGEPHALTGNIVCAKIKTAVSAEQSQLKKKIRKLCRSKLAPHKIPVKIFFTERTLTTPRQKKIRK